VAVIELNDSDLQTLAQACRIAAAQADQDTAKQSSPTIRANFEASARRYRELVAKLERAQFGHSHSK
jgi:hypothetical protein